MWTRGDAERLAQQRGAHGDPETDKERDGEIERQIGRDGLGRLARVVDDRDVGSAHACGEARFLGFLLHAQVQIVAGVRLLAHDGVFGGGLIQLHALTGRLLQALAHQLLAIESGLPVAAEAFDQFRVLGLLLPVEILQLAANFDDARKAGAVFGAELGLFLLQVAAAGVNLLQERGGKVGVSACRRGSAAMTISGSPCEAARYSASAKNAVGGGGHKLAAELVDLEQGRAVFGFAGLAVGQNLRRAHNAVLRLEVGQALLVPVDASLQVGKLGIEPAGGLRRGLNLRFGFLLL